MGVDVRTSFPACLQSGHRIIDSFKIERGRKSQHRRHRHVGNSQTKGHFDDLHARAANTLFITSRKPDLTRPGGSNLTKLQLALPHQEER